MSPHIPFRKMAMKIPGTRGSALDLARGRLVVVSVFFALFYILIAVRLFDLTILQGELQKDSMNVATPAPQVTAEAEALRADIVDRNGVLLATSLETPSLYVDPAMVANPAQAAQDLTAALPDLRYEDILQKLQRKSRFVWIKRNLTPEEQYKVLLIGEPGFAFKSEKRRIYPQGELAAHMVGYTNVDGMGLAGVERSFDKLLKAGGKPLTLTLDIRLQHILRRETMAAMKEFSGTGAAGLVMDVGTGEILAAVSLPDFDPHNPTAVGDAAVFNRLTLGVYELGSTFKLFSTAALLEKNGGKLDMTFDAREPLVRGRFRINDYHAEKRIMTVPEVFMVSSNIGAALMGEYVGTEGLQNFYSDLGFMAPSPLAIEEIGKPIIPRPWRDINTLTASYGHGIAVSPLQMVTAAATVLGDGIVVTPTIVAGHVKNNQNRRDLRVISPQTAHRLRQLMRLVVTDGTGNSADVPGYRVGGKTGTAEQPGPRGGYDKRKLISSFLGVFPSDAPRYVVFVMVQDPKGTKATYGYATGGWVGAPAVKHVIEALGPMMNVTPHVENADADIATPLKRYIKASTEGKADATQ
ncbi:MAG: penicillin-binding protein 2 [Alphaproteobacteria bacterium]|nr:penicillin-binding protein 2 [Alphaproteobacteria bacterium]